MLTKNNKAFIQRLNVNSKFSSEWKIKLTKSINKNNSKSTRNAAWKYNCKFLMRHTYKTVWVYKKVLQSLSLLHISSQHNTKKKKWKGKKKKMFDVCTRRRWEFLYIHLHVKMKGMLLRFLFSSSSPLHYHSLDTCRKNIESEKSTKYIHLCIHIIKWKGCSDQKFMTSFSRVVVTLICFVVFFSLPYVCMCLSFSFSLYPLSHSPLPILPIFSIPLSSL